MDSEKELNTMATLSQAQMPSSRRLNLRVLLFITAVVLPFVVMFLPVDRTVVWIDVGAAKVATKIGQIEIFTTYNPYDGSAETVGIRDVDSQAVDKEKVKGFWNGLLAEGMVEKSRWLEWRPVWHVTPETGFEQEMGKLREIVYPIISRRPNPQKEPQYAVYNPESEFRVDRKTLGLEIGLLAILAVSSAMVMRRKIFRAWGATITIVLLMGLTVLFTPRLTDKLQVEHGLFKSPVVKEAHRTLEIKPIWNWKWKPKPHEIWKKPYEMLIVSAIVSSLLAIVLFSSGDHQNTNSAKPVAPAEGRADGVTQANGGSDNGSA